MAGTTLMCTGSGGTALSSTWYGGLVSKWLLGEVSLGLG
jgi:hypothetical protein